MKEVSVGKHYSPEWLGTKYYKHPPIIALSQLKFHFESMTELTNVNLTAELTAALQTHTNVIDAITQAYTTVPAFVDYIKASLQYEVIRRRSKERTTSGLTWSKAYDALQSGASAGKPTTLLAITDAVKLAEAHLRKADASPVKPRVQAATITEIDYDEEADLAGAGGVLTVKQRHVATTKLSRAKDNKIQELKPEAQLAQGKENYSPQTQRNCDQRTRSGKGGGDRPKVDCTELDCKECCERHWGLCLKDHIKAAKERTARDEQTLLDMQQLKSKKQCAALLARAARDSLDKDNEEFSDYFSVLPCPGDAPTALNVFPGHITLSFSSASTISEPET
eukprot:3941044-Rhodomonas_salina.1